MNNNKILSIDYHPTTEQQESYRFVNDNSDENVPFSKDVKRLLYSSLLMKINTPRVCVIISNNHTLFLYSQLLQHGQVEKMGWMHHCEHI